MKNKKMIFLIIIFLFSSLTVKTAKSNGVAYFDLVFLTPDTSPARIQWSQLIETNLEMIGINVTYNNFTGWGGIGPRTWSYPFIEHSYIPTYEEGGYDVLFVGWAWGLDFDPTGLYDTASITPAGDNYYQYSNPVYDNLLDDFLAELDPPERTSIAHDLQGIIYEDLPSIGIIYPRQLLGYKVGLTGIDDLMFATSNHRSWLWDDPDDHIIKYAIPADLREYNIYEATSFFDYQWMQCVHGALAQREQVTHEWGPVIAKNWTIEGPLPGAEFPINITVNLDPDAKFSDGEPVLPEDVKYSYQLHMTPRMASGEYGYLVRFFGNELINPNQGNNSIVINDNSPGGQIEFRLVDMYNFPESLLKYHILDKYKGDGTGVEELIGSYGYDIFLYVLGTAPIGFNLVKSCGAFMVNSFDSVNSIVHMVRNPYWKDNIVSGSNDPYLTDLYVVFVVGKDNVINEMKLGNYDMMDAQYYPELSDFEGETLIEGVLVKIPQHQELSVNMKHPIIGTGELTPIGTSLAAKYLRKAISHAIPRQTIVDDILNGTGVPGIVPVPDACIGFDDSLEPYSYNLTLAQEYIELVYTPVIPEITFSNIILCVMIYGISIIASFSFRRLLTKRNK